MKTISAYKLLVQRKDGSLGPLFINKRQRIPIGKWLKAEDHPTPGYQHRPGWHAMAKPEAPHLSDKGRVWCKVELRGVQEHQRPASQGGRWYLARQMRVTLVLDPGVVKLLRGIHNIVQTIEEQAA